MNGPSRGFTLLESLLSVALIALAAGVLAAGVSGLSDTRAFHDARSSFMDADARARVMARTGGSVSLTVERGGIALRVDRDGRAVLRRDMPHAVRVEVTVAGKDVAAIGYGPDGRTADYSVSFMRGEHRERRLIGGITGWMFESHTVHAWEPSR